jgi:hypothetical protein
VCPRRFPPHHRINDDARAALDDLIELSRTIWGVYDVPEVLVCQMEKPQSHTNFYIQPNRTKRSLYIITSAAEDDSFNWTNFMGV